MATITTSDELRLINRSRILNCLRNAGPLSRTCIGEYTGISAATVTQVTASLIEDGVIKQVAPDPVIALSNNGNARRGRPQVVLELNAEAASTAVLSLLLNRIEVNLYDYAGRLSSSSGDKVDTSTLTSDKLESLLFRIMDDSLAANVQCSASLKHIEMIYQGTVSSNNDALLWSPITDVRQFRARDILQRRYNVPVNVSNDCNTIARALYSAWQTNARARNSKPGNNFGAVLLSYGIGMGLIHQGSILTGSLSSGTEFGHMLIKADGALCRCGRHGCIEAYASDYAIMRRAKGRPPDSTPENRVSAQSFSRLIEIATRQPGPERDAFAEAGAAIGQGLNNLYALFDPFPTVLVGTSAAAFALMEDSLNNNLRHHANGDTSNYVFVHKDPGESNLIHRGAALHALSYIDEELFGFGEKINIPSCPVQQT